MYTIYPHKVNHPEFWLSKPRKVNLTTKDLVHMSHPNTTSWRSSFTLSDLHTDTQTELVTLSHQYSTTSRDITIPHSLTMYHPIQNSHVVHACKTIFTIFHIVKSPHPLRALTWIFSKNMNKLISPHTCNHDFSICWLSWDLVWLSF